MSLETANDSTETKLEISADQQQRYLSDIFSGKGVEEPNFLYLGNGSALYGKLANKEGEYKFYKTGLDLIEDNKDIIRKYIGETFVDIGPGNGDKAGIVLSGYNRDVEYVEVDPSIGMLRESNRNLKSNNISVTGEGIVPFEEGEDSIMKNFNTPTYFFVGGTIGNFSNEKIDNQLKKMGNNSFSPIKGNSLIFDYFSAPNNISEIKTTIESYNGPDTKAWFENGLKVLGLNESDISNKLTYTVRYTGVDGQVYAESQNEDIQISDNFVEKKNYPGFIEEGFVAKKSCTLDIDLINGGKLNPPIKIEEGKFYLIERSRRFSEEEINKYLEESGYKRKRVRLKQGEGMKLGIATKQGEKWQRNRGLIRKIAGAALLIALGVGGDQLVHGVIKQKEKNKIEISINEKSIDVGSPNRPYQVDEAYREKEAYYKPLKQEMISRLWDIIDTKDMSKNDIKDVELMFINFLTNELKNYSEQAQKEYEKEWAECTKNMAVKPTKAPDHLFTPYEFYTSCEKKDMENLIYKFINNNLIFLKNQHCGLTNCEFINNILNTYDINTISDNVNSLDYDIKISVTGEETVRHGDRELQSQKFKPLNLKQGDHVVWQTISNDEKFYYTTESGDKYLVFFTKLWNDDGGEKEIMLASLVKENNIINAFEENITKKSINGMDYSLYSPFSYTFSTQEGKIVLDDILKHEKKFEDRPDIFPNTYSNYLKSVENNFMGIESGLLFYDSDMRNISLFGNKDKEISYDLVKNREQELVNILNKLQKDYDEIGEKEYTIYNEQQQKYISKRIKDLKNEMQEIINMCTILQHYIRLEAEKLGLKLDSKDHDYYQNKINELGLSFGSIGETGYDGLYCRSIENS